MSISRPDETFQFPSNMPIEISYRKTQTYSKCRTYDSLHMNQGFVWHQIIVQHMEKVRSRDDSQTVVEAIMETVKGEELFPIAYRHGVKEDRFLVRQCKEAIDKLFEQNLRIQLSNASFVNLQVQFNVGDFKYGQISPYIKISDALNRLYTCTERVNGVNGILNLSRFAEQEEFFQMIVYLGNRAVFERVCDMIYRNDEKFRSINGLILSNNNITTLVPLKMFAGVEFAVLDLRSNKLSSATRLCRELNDIKADELLLADNPLCHASNYPECLRPILKNFKLIDGIPAESLSKNYTPLDYDVNMKSDGYRIDASNKSDIMKFQHSNDWHAVFIPDAEQAYTKEEIFDYFFITVSTTLSDIYPAYYKFAGGEHQFLVRQCFDQLKYLLEVCNLVITVPRLTDFTNDAQIQIDKILKYYLRMDISSYKIGQVDPLECIDKAITRRFCVIDRLLNMENFQATEGLENITINLSSPKILSRVLMQASRKCLTNCIELRLARNKIVNANFPKALGMMSGLKAIDLGNNWIHDLSDIKELQTLGLKSLRLDGNPLCTKYTTASEYIKAVRKCFPSLTKLDNVAVSKKAKPIVPKNFLCDVNGYDFVEEFVSSYFVAFESNERENLKDWYHPNAIFTMCCNYLMTQMNSQTFKRLEKYMNNSRNILKISDLSRAHKSIHLGPEQIMQVFLQLPNMLHDKLTFTTDTPIYNENLVVITVQGVYYDQAASIMDNDILMAFTRTFVVMAVDKEVGVLKKAAAYKIVNEQLNIFNPTAEQIKNAFKYFKTESSDQKDNVTIEDKEAMIIMFQEVTNLKTVWSSRCLDDAKWNFQKALVIFLSLCDRKEIPDTAFL